MQSVINLDSNISALKGVGEKRLALFNVMSIYTVADLIGYFPRDYIDRSVITPIVQAEIGGTSTVKCTVTGIADNIRLNGKTISKIIAKDNSGAIEVVWFNRPYMRSNFKIGSQWIFTGKVVRRFNKLCMECQEYEAVSDKELLSTNRIVPVYRLINGLTQKLLRQTIHLALKSAGDLTEETFPQEMLEKHGLIGKAAAIRNIHFPESDDMFFKARERLVFEELFFIQLALAMRRTFIKSRTPHKYSDTDISPILEKCPFALTDAQNGVVGEMLLDIKNGYVINRLVQGDVGSGKTMVAVIMAYLAAINGGQAAVMAPTEILAMQHFDTFSKYFEQMGITVVLLSGSMKKSEKEAAYAQISSGGAKIIIGTHAVIQNKVDFHNLTLVITDEQHRFGVKQRDSLTKKGMVAHKIVMSATPIPRTLAMVLYGDMDISIIDEMPPGRKPIKTYAVTGDYRKRIFAFIDKQCDTGRQVYIICPTIEQSEQEGLKDVISYTKKLKKALLERRIECLHGKLSGECKQKIMDAFAAGDTDILVATTVIEVGIDVRNATVMLIENAERFGLSQLHQLRGRVGRGAEESHCILITDDNSQTSQARTQIMAQTNDGFKVAEKDLELRGAGDFFGTAQHGLSEMKIVNLYKDIGAAQTVKCAVEDAFDGAKSGKAEYLQLFEVAGGAVDFGFREVL